jgi:hypothetical protein
MEDVIDRVRAALEKKAAELDYKEGLEAGRAWAARDADPLELLNLEQHRERLGEGWDAAFADVAEPAAEGLAFAIAIDAGDRGAVREFWGAALGDAAPKAKRGAFLRGFAEGALGLWDEVSAEVPLDP